MSARLVIVGPDFRIAAKEHKRIIDSALDQHRKKFGPRHFTQRAKNRYGAAYDGHGKSEAQRAQAAAERNERFKQMTPAERQQARRELIRQQGANKDRKNQRPLYKTGLLMRRVLNGSAKGVGPASRRRLQVGPMPFYIGINPPKQINKKRALTAVTADEAAAFAKQMDRDLQKYFNTKKRKG